MRHVFSFGLLAAAISYTFYGLRTLEFMSGPIPGPGYFPLVVGVGLIALTGYNFGKGLMHYRASLSQQNVQKEKSHEEELCPADVVWILVLFVGFILILPLVGALLSMIAFVWSVMFVINREKPVKNLVYGVLLAGALYLLFETLLRAGLPAGSLWS